MHFACFILLSRYFNNSRRLKNKIKLRTLSDNRETFFFILYLPFEIAKIKAREMPSHKNREIKYQGILSDIDIPANVKTMGLVTME